MSESPALLLIGYNRPDLLLKRISEIAEMHIQYVHISIDGGNESHTIKMRNLLNEAQGLVSEKTNLKITHHRKNLGMSHHITESITTVLESHNSVVVVEDDIALNKNFFKNISIGLKILSARQQLGTVSAFSPLNYKGNRIINNMWRSTPYFYCWGWGCSKESWENYKINITDEDLAVSLSDSTSWNKLSNFQKNFWISKFDKVKENCKFTWDYQMQYASFKYDYLNLSPVFRFVDNVGFNDSKAVNTKGAKPYLLRSPAKNMQIVKKNTNMINNYFYEFIDSNLLTRDSRVSQLFQKHKTNLQKILAKVSE